MATRKKSEAKKSDDKTKKARKKPERMGEDFLAVLFDHIEFVGIARLGLEEATSTFQSYRDNDLPEELEKASLRVVGAARRLDRTIQNARDILKGKTFSGLVVEGFKARLEQAEQASRVGWSLVEDRF